MAVVPYFPVRDEALKKIINLKLAKISAGIRRIRLTFDDKLVDEVARRCTEVESGARNVDNILSNSLLPDISRQLLGHMAEGESSAIHVDIGDNGEFVYN